MRALRNHGQGRVSLVESQDPVPGPGDALVRIEASAVCGSERGALMEGVDGNTGHEAAGTLVDPGSSRFRAGDRVGLSAVVGCGECDRCTARQELHCRRGPCSAAKSGGWHAELAVVSPSALRELPPGMDAGVGALFTGDALGVPSRGYGRVPSEPAERVLVIGLGPVGLGHVLVRAFEGAEVVAIEPAEFRRDLALKLGARAVGRPGDDIGHRPRLVIECSGRPESIAYALDVVDNGGVVLQSGECHSDVLINPSDTFIRREITYTGAWYYATEDYPAMCALHERGLPLAHMCTHDVDAAHAQDAITDFLGQRAGKVLLRWS
ncbi:(R,R)-butanediol dehydrogenase / meso-butanediol dehydrogenase / diacetyl reductase [Jiangella alba]|uniref:(R,R)-butanediol dehydrogenase / meso-butanediol dehydrogenase / diacetyl reductase n=1 Tax=Jiangella alba TaxID=561176 RepID=A0A1H5JVG4_9ACTN|nr:(R,R)-butanediol dehydrogenase / meso-butanediol dehydrogenase / diacetyl reductase [Jiangella alba]